MSPNNEAVIFNLAFVQFTRVEMIRSMPKTSRTLEELQEAAVALDVAVEQLSSLATSSHPPYPADEIQQRANMGRNTLKRQLERAIQAQREFETETSEKRGAARKAREEADFKVAEEQASKKAAEEARRAQIAAERRRMAEEAREWAEIQQQDGRGDSSSGGISGSIDDHDIEVAGNGVHEESKSEPKSKQKHQGRVIQDDEDE